MWLGSIFDAHEVGLVVLFMGWHQFEKAKACSGAESSSLVKSVISRRFIVATCLDRKYLRLLLPWLTKSLKGKITLVKTRLCCAST